MRRGDHRDGANVFCEEHRMFPTWDEKWMKKYGSLPYREIPRSTQVTIPAFTVQYFGYHIRDKKGFVFAERGPNSPWAYECRRFYPELFRAAEKAKPSAIYRQPSTKVDESSTGNEWAPWPGTNPYVKIDY